MSTHQNGEPEHVVAGVSDPAVENVQLLSTHKTSDYRPALLTLPRAKGELEGVPMSAPAYPNHQPYPEGSTFPVAGVSGPGRIN
jgi:hypothetical protein